MSDDYLTLGALARTLPGRPAAASVWRWCRVGLRSRDGQLHRLPHARCGKKLLVRPADAEQFFQKLADADVLYFGSRDEAAPKVTAPSESARTRRADAANKRLEKAGL